MPFSYKLDNWPARFGLVLFIIVAGLFAWSIYGQLKGGAKVGLYPDSPDATVVIEPADAPSRLR